MKMRRPAVFAGSVRLWNGPADKDVFLPQVFAHCAVRPGHPSVGGVPSVSAQNQVFWPVHPSGHFRRPVSRRPLSSRPLQAQSPERFLRRMLPVPCSAQASHLPKADSRKASGMQEPHSGCCRVQERLRTDASQLPASDPVRPARQHAADAPVFWARLLWAPLPGEAAGHWDQACGQSRQPDVS